MDLYLIRHADAVPLGEDGISTDADRPLTATGQAQVRALASALQRHGVDLERLFTSPLLRARQTAEGIVAHWVGALPDVAECAALAPGGNSKDLASFLREHTGAAVGLVGHQPDLSEHVAWLIGSKKAQLDMAKAGVAALRCGEPRKGGGMLIWLVTPEWFGPAVG